MARNIIYRALMLCVASLLLASCGGRYSPPPPDFKLPPVWSGNAHLDPAINQIDFEPGIKRSGDYLVKTRVKSFREGRIVDEIKYQNPYGKNINIPADTPVYAQQLTVTRTNLGGPGPSTSENLNALTNPIEWCYETPDDAKCIFYEREDRARYISIPGVSRTESMPLPIFDTERGVRGPLPNIVEDDKDVGGAVFLVQKILDINDEGFLLVTLVKDGLLQEKEVRRAMFRWAPDSYFQIDFMIIKAVKNAEGKVDAVEVTKAKPPRWRQ